MNIYTFSLGLLGTNCYVIEKDQLALIFDPGGDVEKLEQLFNEKEIKPKAIVLTHAHFDHIGAVEPLRERYDVPVYMHEAEKEWLTNPMLNGSELFQVGKIMAREADYYIDEGVQEIEGFKLEILHTPGHSPGSLSFWLKDEQTLIAGDTLFQMGIGRTDLPLGNYDTLIKSINEKILSLPEETSVLPGHGPKTTVKAEKQRNPFLS
ncbi:MBL fold metallo-hydrolase [Alkalibacillus aidingensis]|uniref:MBL fold metallo-hydrolase n=1 Tax=Alkalibacillus aidingensis TaxID=2747607 RepID=UPI001660F7F4|nr:MBL fold metallo-hydrolase [Alkalibacillus aidingensis]